MMSTDSESAGNAEPISDYQEVTDSSDRATDAGDAESEASPLPLDQVFEVLKNERRRTVLRYLDDHEEPVSLGDLAEHVAANENDTPVRQISSRERKCAYVGLYQCHLPKMDDMDVIDFNQNRGLVESGANISQIEEYVEWSGSDGRRWPVYYASTATLGLVAIIALVLAGSLTAAVAASVAVLSSTLAIAVFHEQRSR